MNIARTKKREIDELRRRSEREKRMAQLRSVATDDESCWLTKRAAIDNLCRLSPNYKK